MTLSARKGTRGLKTSGSSLLLEDAGDPAPGLPPVPSSPPVSAAPPAEGLTGRGDGGAGVGVLGAAVGALLVAVVLVGRDTFVASQRFTCEEEEEEEWEQRRDPVPQLHEAFAARGSPQLLGPLAGGQGPQAVVRAQLSKQKCYYHFMTVRDFK